MTGLKYFFGQLAGRRHWKRFKELNREVQELTPVIASSGAGLPVKCNSPCILTMTRAYSGSIYVIAVNIENAQVVAVLDLSPLPVGAQNTAKVAFEDRRLVLQGKVLRDRFAPFARHVYVCRPGPD